MQSPNARSLHRALSEAIHTRPDPAVLIDIKAADHYRTSAERAVSACVARTTMHITVESYTDKGGAQLPRRFSLDGRGVDVVEVVDRWHGRDHIYFKVKGDDANVYILRLDENRDDWEMTLFETPQAEGIAIPAAGRKGRRGDGA